MTNLNNKNTFIRGLLKRDGIFLLLFLVFASVYYIPFISSGPLNVHLWRQADCLSITDQYAKGASFFSPEMNILLADHNTTGKSAGEFPVLYYIVGQIWKITGQSFLVYRLFYLLILFAGLYAFFRSLHILLKDKIWASVLTGLLFTSPLLVSYGLSFLTDIPAFALVLIALYFFLRYAINHHNKHLYVSLVFFTLAGLIKTSSLIAFLFLFGILALETLGVPTLHKRKVFSISVREWIGFTLVVLSVLAWYIYAAYYNHQHGFKYTFNNIWPYWMLSSGDRASYLSGIRTFTSHVFFSRSLIFLLLYLGIINLFMVKRIPLFAYLANIVIILGSVTYFILWSAAMPNHDYYFSPLLILFAGIIIPFVYYVSRQFPSVFRGRIMRIMLWTFLLLNFLYCTEAVRLKTKSEHGAFPMVGSQEFVNLMRWTNSDVRTNWYRFYRMRSYLKNDIGMREEDKIISLPDVSFNVSLFLSGYDGWTDFKKYHTPEAIERLIQKGANYLLISNDDLLNKKYLQPFIRDSVGDFEGIRIYRLHMGMFSMQKD